MVNNKSYKYTKYACYFSNVCGAIVCNLSAILLVTFREIYNISYTLLGLLVLINFFTQLVIDLVFSFFPNLFNIEKSVKTIPIITAIGLAIYAVLPNVFPDYAYIAIVVGTVIFSVAGGLGEVLISPIIAAIPSDNPDREMSKLHSFYAWGFVLFVVISTVILKLIGKENWMYMVFFWLFIPILTSALFAMAKIPDMNGESKEKSGKRGISKFGISLCFICIFLGGASELSMSQWVSGFAEKALNIPKVYGDIFGMALFAVFLGLGRSLYAKYGKNIINTLLLSMIGATACYLTAALVQNSIINLAACVLTGFCVALLWPGTLILVGEKYPAAGVAVYALLAAGGDLGGAIAPQLVGIITDEVSKSAFAQSIAKNFAVTTEQVGMKFGIMFAGIFPLLGVVLVLIMKYYFVKRKN